MWENSERKYGADRRCLGFLIRHAALTVYYTYSSTVYSSTLYNPVIYLILALFRSGTPTAD